MNIEVEFAQGKMPITILSLQGDLDASNFESVIARASDLYTEGTRHLLLDLSGLRFMSSSGLVAMHSIALLMRGADPHDLQDGWNAIHAIDRDRESGPQPYVKILNPLPKVASTLKMTGLDQFFEIFDDQRTAIASF